jgi:hypothetical protein
MVARRSRGRPRRRRDRRRDENNDEERTMPSPAKRREATPAPNRRAMKENEDDPNSPAYRDKGRIAATGDDAPMTDLAHDSPTTDGADEPSSASKPS